MNNEAFLRDYLEDAQNAYALFVQMDRKELIGLHDSFRQDMQAAETPGALAFCAGRLALILDILWQRGETPDSIAHDKEKTSYKQQ
jgi:hypothetical protein